MESVEEMLSPSTPGKYEVGGVRINKYVSPKTSWNYKEIERLLTPEQLSTVKVTRDILITRRDAAQVTTGDVKQWLTGVSELLLVEGGNDVTPES